MIFEKNWHHHLKYLVLLVLIVACVIFGSLEAIGNDPSLRGGVMDDDLFDNHGTVMLILDGDTGQIVDANLAAVAFYGYDFETLRTMTITDINMLTQKEVQIEMASALEEERNYFKFKHRLADGTVKDVEAYSYPVKRAGEVHIYAIIHDVTARRIAEERYQKSVNTQLWFSTAMILVLGVIVSLLIFNLRRRREVEGLLKESEEAYAHLFNHIHEGYALNEVVLDEEGHVCDYRFLKMNHSFEVYTGLKGEEAVGKTVLEVTPSTEAYWIRNYGKVALEGKTVHVDYLSKDDGKYYSVDAYQAGHGKFITLLVDRTDAKKKEEEILYLNHHDQLTNLYNRRYMEEQLELLDIPMNLPMSIIMADVNGLKLANDAFGHKQGDDLLVGAAAVFRSVFREQDIVCRVGGDEFVIVLPKTPQEKVAPVIERLKKTVESYKVGPIPLSVSFGSETKNSVKEDLQLIYKKAEDKMYHNKLTESKQARKQMIQHIIDKIEKDYGVIHYHQRRVSALAEASAEAFGVPAAKRQKFKETALYHDIGLVAIDVDFSEKTGMIDEERMPEIRRHAECGYRILSAISDYSEVADIVLAHHEWYDGTGYPKGLEGDKIPLLARILALLDDYDTMTHSDGHRHTKEEAAQAILKYAGTKFDPALAEVFVAWLRDEEKSEVLVPREQM